MVPPPFWAAIRFSQGRHSRASGNPATAVSRRLPLDSRLRWNDEIMGCARLSEPYCPQERGSGSAAQTLPPQPTPLALPRMQKGKTAHGNHRSQTAPAGVVNYSELDYPSNAAAASCSPSPTVPPRTRVVTVAVLPEAAAQRMGIPQPKVSCMMRGDFTNLSERKLMDCLNRLGYDIEIKVRPAAEPVGRLALAIA